MEHDATSAPTTERRIAAAEPELAVHQRTDRVVVLGMHRSGTSLSAGLLAVSGLFVANDEEIMPPADENPLGFFENLGIVETNDQVLASLGRSWSNPPLRQEVTARQTELTARLRRALEHLDASRPSEVPVVLKDPRMSVLLPAWGPLLFPDSVVVLATRNPLDIARSLALRNDFPISVGLALWEAHTVELMHHLRGRIVHVCKYDAITKDPAAAVRFIDDVHADLDFVPSAYGSIRAVDTLLQPGLQHHSSEHGDLEQFATVSQARLWAAMHALPAGRQRLEIDAASETSSGSLRALVEQDAKSKRLAQLAERAHLVDAMEISVRELREARSEQAATSEESLAALAQEAADHRARADSLEVQLSKKDSDLQEALASADSEREEGVSRTRGAEQHVVELQSRLDSQTDEATALSLMVARLEAELEDRGRERATLAAQRDRLDADLNQSRQVASLAALIIATISGERSALAERLQSVETHSADLETRVSQLGRRAGDLVDALRQGKQTTLSLRAELLRAQDDALGTRAMNESLRAHVKLSRQQEVDASLELTALREFGAESARRLQDAHAELLRARDCEVGALATQRTLTLELERLSHEEANLRLSAENSRAELQTTNAEFGRLKETLASTQSDLLQARDVALGAEIRAAEFGKSNAALTDGIIEHKRLVAAAQDEVARIEGSRSFRLGRAITSPVRLLRGPSRRS